MAAREAGQVELPDIDFRKASPVVGVIQGLRVTAEEPDRLLGVRHVFVEAADQALLQDRAAVRGTGDVEADQLSLAPQSVRCERVLRELAHLLPPSWLKC